MVFITAHCVQPNYCLPWKTVFQGNGIPHTFNAYPNHVNMLKFNASFKVWALWLQTLCLNSRLAQFCRYIGTLLRGLHCSKTDGLCIGWCNFRRRSVLILFVSNLSEIVICFVDRYLGESWGNPQYEFWFPDGISVAGLFSSPHNWISIPKESAFWCS